MKRTPLRRTTRLKAGTKRLKVRRRSKRFAARRDPVYAKWVRSGLCLIGEQCFGAGVDACHVKTRGAGGDDRGNLVPLCRQHHRDRRSDVRPGRGECLVREEDWCRLNREGRECPYLFIGLPER